MAIQVGTLDFHAGAIRKLAVGMALGLGMGALGLLSSGTAAADGMLLSASHPAIIDADGTEGDWYFAVQGTVSAGAPIVDSDGFQAAKP